MHRIQDLLLLVMQLQRIDSWTILTVVIPVCKDAQLCHSVVCHDKRVEAAKIASQLSFEKLPIALWRPLIAVPR